MEFKEVNNALFQAKIIRTYQPEGSIDTKSDWVCRIPVHCTHSGIWDTPKYELLPGYHIIPPDRIKISISGWFAYLYYDNLYIFNQVTVDEALTGGTVVVTWEQETELDGFATDKEKYWQHVLCATDTTDWQDLRKWTDSSYYGLYELPNTFEGELWDGYIVSEATAKLSTQIRGITEEFIRENY